MGTVARFGDNLRAIRRRARKSQKELAAYIRNEDGALMHQAHLSKLEGMEWAPRPDTVQRVADGLAALLRIPSADVVRELLDGVAGRYDSVSLHRATEEQQALAELSSRLAQLPEKKRRQLFDEMDRRVADILGRKRTEK